MAVMSVDHLHDMDMVDSAGQRVGAVKDLLIDVGTGRMCYVIVAPGQGGIAGALGIGERLVAIPFAAVRLESGQLLLARDAAMLAGAPAYARGHPPTFDAPYEQELARYWSTEAPDVSDRNGASLTAGAIASSALPEIAASESLGTVARVLAEKQAEAAQVLDGEGHVMGIITLRDVALALGRSAAPIGALPSRAGDAVRTAGGDAGPAQESVSASAEAGASAADVGEAPAAEAVLAGPGTDADAETAASVPAAQELGEPGAAAPTTQPRQQAQQAEDARSESDVVPCPNCGHANRSSATFCAACGTRLR